MERTQFWKNFNLGTELSLSGSFIYNGLRSFHDMDTLYYEEDIFEVLYSFSVGIERLLKIAVVLVEHSESVDQEKFEQSLITHNHQDLLNRVKQKQKIKLGVIHNDFLQMLSKFYKTYRYDRYSLLTLSPHGKEKKNFHNFISKHLKIEIQDEFPSQITQNSNKIKKFIGKTVGKIAENLYGVIKSVASDLNIYTYEITVYSKAYKIFMKKEYNFLNEDILWKEILIYLMNSSELTCLKKFLMTIDPLEFDPGLIPDYLQSFGSDKKKLERMDELETLYKDIDSVKERLQLIDMITNANFIFDDEIDDEA